MKMCENCSRPNSLCEAGSMSNCEIAQKVLYEQICETLKNYIRKIII